MKLKYVVVEKLSQTEVEAAILRDNPTELLHAVLSAALYAEDAAWAEDVCVRLVAHEHDRVRCNAIQGFGHIARIHKQLNEVRVKPLIESALDDPSADVRGEAEDARDEIKFRLQWRFKRKKKHRT